MGIYIILQGEVDGFFKINKYETPPKFQTLNVSIIFYYLLLILKYF